MDIITQSLIAAVVSGIVGGTITGATAWLTIKVHIQYLRRDVDHAHKRLDSCHLIK